MRDESTARKMQEAAMDYVSYVLDTALSPDRQKSDIKPGHVLVGWQCGFEPLFVAVVGAYDHENVDETEAEEIALDYLDEIKWFGDGVEGREPDYIIKVR